MDDLQTSLCYIEANGKFLMMHRIKKENDLNHDKWVGIGGKFLDGETPEECMLREVREETGLELKDWRYRAIVYFRSDEWPPEAMHLFTASPLSEEISGECGEGVLEWVDKDKVCDLPIWEGDKIFFALLNAEYPFFELELCYEGDTLIKAVLDGRQLYPAQ